MKKFLGFLLLSSFFYCNSYAASLKGINVDNCPVDFDTFNRVIDQARKKNPDIISSLSECLRYNHKLILQICIIDPSQLAKAPQAIRDDENFVYRLLKIHPNILQYASNRLKNDRNFLERCAYISREAIRYADLHLLDNIIFMKKMIELDSYNYKFASKRIKSSIEHASLAFMDNGNLLMYAPSEVQNNKQLVKIAVVSNNNAIDFASEKLKNDPEIQYLSRAASSFSKEDLENFLRKNFIKSKENHNLGFTINREFSLHKKNHLIDRNYITKWQRAYRYRTTGLQENWHLMTVDSRNEIKKWQEDFKKMPDLTKKIENFLEKRTIDADTIKNLSLINLWQIKKTPLTLAFQLYLLRDSNDAELGDQFVNVTSIVAIAQKVTQKVAQKTDDKDWRISIIQVIFDSEIKVDVPYENGHKQYFLQDLYYDNKKDQNPKLIFRVEDKFREYFEIFEEQRNGKYQMIYRLDPANQSLNSVTD